MTEQDLISLGFQKNLGEEGLDWYYYDLDLGNNKGVSLISPASDEVEAPNKWYVEIFEDPSIRFDRFLELANFIEVVKRNIK